MFTQQSTAEWEANFILLQLLMNPIKCNCQFENDQIIFEKWPTTCAPILAIIFFPVCYKNPWN